jgi:glycerophosphoryl diester phosphodiesterase
VWTVNDSESMERLLGLGVDGIISDVPTTLCGVLGTEGVAWNGE